MILTHRERFGLSRYHRARRPDAAISLLAQGPILRLQIEFESWLDRTPQEAEAFLDPGADSSWVSMRWIRDCAQKAGTHIARPKLDPRSRIVERMHFHLAGKRLPIGDAGRPVRVGGQERDHGVPQMPGFEDMLLGRDLITQHQLLVLIDGDSHNFSILLPDNLENLTRRKRILSAFDPEEPIE